MAYWQYLPQSETLPSEETELLCRILCGILVLEEQNRVKLETEEMRQIPSIPQLEEAQLVANHYLASVLSANYRATNGFRGNDCWYFLIQFVGADNKPIGLQEKLVIDERLKSAAPLTDEQIQDLRQAPLVLSASSQGQLARDQRGHILRYQAKRIATRYLRTHLTMHFSATGGLWVPLQPSIWQFSIRCRLAHIEDLEPLGIVDVDAQTGEVVPLQTSQLQQIRQRANAIIQHHELAPAA